MKRIDDMIKNLQEFQATITEIVREAVSESQTEILDGVRQNLREGKRGDGADITPSYLDDPFFESKPQAVAYMNYKKSISLPSKNMATPDLYINGWFHSKLGIKLDAETFTIEGTAPLSMRISDKYAPVTFAMSDANRNVFARVHVLPKLLEKIHKI